MGRKGVSKRKPNQKKSKPYLNGSVSGGVASVVQAVESQPLKTIDMGNVVKNAGNLSTEGKKKNKKR
jgi:hypothetical protein